MFITIFFVTSLVCNSLAADIYINVTYFIPMYEKKRRMQLNVILKKVASYLLQFYQIIFIHII